MSEEPEQGESGKLQGSAANLERAPAAARRWRGWMLRGLGALALVLLLGAVGVARYLRSAQFQERARLFVIAQVERATGGRVELQGVRWSFARLEFELAGLVVHGKESQAEAPLLRTELVQARLQWAPLLRGRIALRELKVRRPLAHVDVYKDGSTNVPRPKLGPGARPDRIEEVLRLAVDHAELSDGLLQWNDEKIRLNGAADGVAVEVGYRAGDEHYEGTAKVNDVRLRVRDFEPMMLGASADFRLYRDRLEVPRLRVSQGHSWLEASGAITGLGSPVAQFAYRGAGDVRELARLVRYRELESGQAQWSGEGTYRWDRNEYASTGKAQGAGVTWANPIVRLEKISGGFAYSLDREHFNVSSIFATALGGTVHGKLDASSLPGSQPLGRMDLEVNGIELEQALRAFATRELPLERLPLAGLTAGTLNVHWVGSLLDARMDGDLRVRPVARAGTLPVTAVVRATVNFKEQSVEVDNVDASTRETHLRTQGRLSANADLQLDVATRNLADLQPVVTSWRGIRARELPMEFDGSAEFRGTVRGRLTSPALAGYLELHDFTTVLRSKEKPENGGAPVEHLIRTRWELLEGDVEYSAARESIRNGLLRRGGALIHLDASVALVNGNYDATQPFSAHVRMDKVAAGDLQALVGSSYPVSGQVSGEVRVEGTEHDLNGSGRISLRDGTAWRQVVRSAAAEVNFTRNEAELRNILVNSDAMQLRGNARINVETSKFGFDLKGTEVKIENLRVVREGKIKVSGRATFAAIGDGTLGAPRINGRLRLRNLAVNGQALGDMDVDAVTHGAQMQLTARSNFKTVAVNLSGEIQLRGQMPMQLTAEVESANLNPLLEAFLPLRHGAATELKMHAEVKGDARRPRDLTAVLVVEHWVTNYGGITVTNDGPMRLTMANQVVRVEQLRMAGERGTRFLELQGEIELGGNREIDLHADGSVNLKVLETVDLKLTAGGVADLNLRINGSLARPSLRGSLKVQNASLTYQDFPNGLSEITGTLAFNQDRLQVQELTARTGGGLLRAQGFIAFSASQGLFVNLSASGHDIRLRYPEGVSSTVDAAFAFTGTRKDALLSGDVTVTRLGLNPQFDFGAYLAEGSRGTVQGIASPLSNLRLDVHVISTPQLQLQTAAARVSGNLDLRLRGTFLRPTVLGRINLLEGMIDFNGTKYRLERGDLTFTNPVRIEPALDIEISTRVRDYDITLGFHGPISKLNTSYRSDPPLSSNDIISLLALGGTAGESMNPALMGTSQYQPSVSAGSSTELIGQALSATMSSRAQRLFGASRVKIDPNVGEALNSGLARVTVEQQISNRLTLTYISSLNQTAQQIIQFEYNLDKGVSIVGVRDQTGVVSFVVLLRKRRK